MAENNSNTDGTPESPIDMLERVCTNNVSDNRQSANNTERLVYHDDYGNIQSQRKTMHGVQTDRQVNYAPNYNTRFTNQFQTKKY